MLYTFLFTLSEMCGSDIALNIHNNFNNFTFSVHPNISKFFNITIVKVLRRIGMKEIKVIIRNAPSPEAIKNLAEYLSKVALK